MANEPRETRRRYAGAEACRRIVDGAPRAWERLRVRAMNFGQHWRTEGVVDVRYSIELPADFFADVLARDLPEWVEDAKRFPAPPALPLEAELRRRGWPSPDRVVADPDLARLALHYFAHDLLLEWLGDGPGPADDSYVLNTVDAVEIDGGVPRIEGTARRGDIHARYQDA